MCCRPQRTSRRGDGELLAFTDVDALRALEVDHQATAGDRRARTPVRGDAARRRAHQSHQSRPVAAASRRSGWSRPMPTSRACARAAAAAGGQSASTGKRTAPASIPAAPLDQRGTRRAPRVKVAGHVERDRRRQPGRRSSTSRRWARRWFRPPSSSRISGCGSSMSDDHGSIRLQCRRSPGPRSRSRQTAAPAIAPASSSWMPTPGGRALTRHDIELRNWVIGN